MESALNWSMVVSIIGVLVVLTNIVVQVLKKLTWDRLPTNVLAVVVSMILTLVTFFAYCQINAIAVVWYMVAAAVVMTSSWRPSARRASSKLNSVKQKVRKLA